MNLQADLGHIAAIAAMLRDMMSGNPDDQAFLDTLEGETNLVEVADALLSRLAETDALADALAEQAKVLAARETRFQARRAALRSCLGALMDAAKLAKLERPLATISRTSPRASVTIVDAAAVPSQLCVTKTTTTPDKTVIKRLLDAGEAVPGAELNPGTPGLMVRFG